MPYNPLNTSLPVELQGVGANQVTNFTWLVDYPFGTQITLNASVRTLWLSHGGADETNNLDGERLGDLVHPHDPEFFRHHLVWLRDLLD